MAAPKRGKAWVTKEERKREVYGRMNDILFEEGSKLIEKHPEWAADERGREGREVMREIMRRFIRHLNCYNLSRRDRPVAGCDEIASDVRTRNG